MDDQPDPAMFIDCWVPQGFNGGILCKGDCVMHALYGFIMLQSLVLGRTLSHWSVLPAT
jgi:hypothetical protein